MKLSGLPIYSFTVAHYRRSQKYQAIHALYGIFLINTSNLILIVFFKNYICSASLFKIKHQVIFSILENYYVRLLQMNFINGSFKSFNKHISLTPHY